MNNDVTTQKRILWIDCAKAVAIVAVITDHCNGLLYTSPYIAYASYFSVSLFVLLSGISVGVNSLRTPTKPFLAQLKKVGRYYFHYAVATLILLIFYSRFSNNGIYFIDLRTYIGHVVNFSIQGPFYFLLFFFQLMLVAPSLVEWCKFCCAQRHPFVWHLTTLTIIAVFCSVLIRHTFILDVHGGGKYLFGGTYLLLFYFGIALAAGRIFSLTSKNRIVLLFSSLGLWVMWVYLMANQKLPFDKYLEEYYGSGFNPPSVNFMLFAIITLFLLYSIFSLSDRQTDRLKVFSFIGRSTLYIFMYHLMVKDVLLLYCPIIKTNIWILRMVVYPSMLLIPALGIYYSKQLRNYIYKVSNMFCK